MAPPSLVRRGGLGRGRRGYALVVRSLGSLALSAAALGACARLAASSACSFGAFVGGCRANPGSFAAREFQVGLGSRNRFLRPVTGDCRTLAVAAEKAQAAGGGGGGTAVADWIGRWVDEEVKKHPVVLFAQASRAAASERAAGALRRDAGIQFHTVDVDMLGGAQSGALVAQYLADEYGHTELPALFIGGRAVASGAADIERYCNDGDAAELAEDAGALAEVAPSHRTVIKWTPGGRTDGRWQPPKNMSGRRWYGDEANMEKNPYDAFSPERMEFAESHWQLSSGTSRHGVTGEGMNLLRDDTNLDEPDMNNKTFSHSPWGSFGRLLLHRPDIGWFGPVMRSRATWLVTQEMADKAGVSERTLRWANGLNKNQMRTELWKRQGKVRVNNVKDADALREELMKELAFERAFSPAGNGVAPGTVIQLSGPEFRAELDADTDVPLLVCVFNPKSALAVKFEGVVELAARRLLRAVRVVEVDGPRNADVARNLSITRFPTLVWLEPRTGRELGRLSGLVSAEAVVEKSKQLLRGGGEGRLLKSPEERPALAFHLDRLPMVDEPRDWGAAIKGTTSRHISNHKGSLCRSGQRR